MIVSPRKYLWWPAGRGLAALHFFITTITTSKIFVLNISYSSDTNNCQYIRNVLNDTDQLLDETPRNWFSSFSITISRCSICHPFLHQRLTCFCNCLHFLLNKLMSFCTCFIKPILSFKMTSYDIQCSSKLLSQRFWLLNKTTIWSSHLENPSTWPQPHLH